MNKKAFTLVELLGVIIILSIIMLIAIPNITRITERTKKDSYINDAKKIVYLAKYEVKKGTINKPGNGESIKVTLKELVTNDVEKDKDGLSYNEEETYVYITRENGNIVYYVQLIADKKNGNHRGILLVNSEELELTDKYKKYYENIDDITEVTPQELNENKKFEVGISVINVEASAKKITVKYRDSKEINIVPKEGYYLESVSCTNGYTTNAITGVDKTLVQTVKISNNGSNKESTCTFTGKKVSYYAEIETQDTTSSKSKVSLKFGGTGTVDIIPKEGYYLASASCTNGYTVSIDTGIKSKNKQSVTISNNKMKELSTCTFRSLPAYPTVTGESNVWTTGTRVFNVTNPLPSDIITRYEYYVSNSNKKPNENVTVTGNFTGSSVTITESGKYIYFRIIYKSGVISEWTSAKNLYVDQNPIDSPTVIGGGTDLAKSRTFMLISPESVSGVSEYQYYVSDIATVPSRSQMPTASFTQPSFTITTSGKYVFFRVINNAKIMSDWTEAKNLYVDNRSYTINYELNGGIQGAHDVTKYNTETETFNLPTPTKTGYKFEGWYENPAFTGAKVEKITKGTTGNKQFYAKWSLESYTIIYDLYGGVMDVDVITSYTIETETFNLPIPTRNGYTFTGWFDTVTTDKVEKIEKGTTGSKIFYAGWSVHSYNVVFNANGGEGIMENQTFKYDDKAPLTPNSFTREGYSFAGWTTNPTSTDVIYTDSQVVSNLSASGAPVNLYAVWDRNVCTIIYNSNTSDNETFTQEVPCENYQSSNVTIAKNTFTKSSTTGRYKFESWSLNTDGTGASYSESETVETLNFGPTKTINLYAKWQYIERLYLFKDGSVNTDITGGWQVLRWGSGTCSVSNSIYCSSGGGNGGHNGTVVKTNNTIDLSNYETLSFKVTSIGGKGDGDFRYVLIGYGDQSESAQNWWYSPPNLNDMSIIVGVNELDISKLQNEKIQITTGSGCYVTITEIYLN